ncbi:MAG: hypothetical protein ACE37F_32350 [Nannocystaceae bacterium]|nr:hypothetical protein [bacterium]
MNPVVGAFIKALFAVSMLIPWVCVLCSQVAGELLVGSVQAASVDVISRTCGDAPVLDEPPFAVVEASPEPSVVVVESPAVSVGSMSSVVVSVVPVVANPPEVLTVEPEFERVAGDDVVVDSEPTTVVDVDVGSLVDTHSFENEPPENSP